MPQAEALPTVPGMFGTATRTIAKAYDALAPDDIAEVLNIAATYELPFGKGKHFMNQFGHHQCDSGRMETDAELELPERRSHVLHFSRQ